MNEAGIGHEQDYKVTHDVRLIQIGPIGGKTTNNDLHECVNNFGTNIDIHLEQLSAESLRFSSSHIKI